MRNVLTAAGFARAKEGVALGSDDELFTYAYVKGSGMLKLMESTCEGAPNWIPTQSGEENVLFANGWSFLDADESEPMSSFDVDAANREGQYKPSWGTKVAVASMSSLGFSLFVSKEDVLEESRSRLSSRSRRVLLEGGTDERYAKRTNNGFDFDGSARQDDVEEGVFACAVGGLPLFDTKGLAPGTASSPWLTFSRPLVPDHVVLVHPEEEATDKRIEVICAKSGCHLGHYFEPSYCINASALDFIPTLILTTNWNSNTNPTSWLPLNQPDLATMRKTILQNIQTTTLSLGGGCFWHCEFALRRLPGIIQTTVGYAGGTTTHPNYRDVSSGLTNHAEVVRVVFDSSVLHPRKLVDCFLAMHDPTTVRAHGKKAPGGQYRSCIVCYDRETEEVAREAMEECAQQLGRPLATELTLGEEGSFWRGEDRHQRHDERRGKKDELGTLGLEEWILEYGRRSDSIWGSSATINANIEL